MAEGEPEGGLVLVVEDEPALLEVMSMTLEFAGYQVIRAPSGTEGAALLETHASDVTAIVLDTLCPSPADSQQVIETLRRLRLDVPILLCSGQFEEESYECVALPVGGGDLTCTFIQKPYPIGALEGTLAKMLARA